MASRFDELLKKRNADSSNKLDRFDSLVMRKLSSSLGNDIDKVNSNINDAYNGWQSADSMKAYGKNIDSLINSLSLYRGYAQKAGIDYKDIDTSINNYKDVMSGWDSLSSQYSKYQTKDDYDTARHYANMTLDDIKTNDDYEEVMEKYHSIEKANAGTYSESLPKDAGLSKEQREIYNYLVYSKNHDNKEADKYLESVGAGELTAELIDSLAKVRGRVKPFSSDVLSLYYGMPSGAIGVAGSMTDHIFGDGIDVNSGYEMPFNISQSLREGRKSQIESPLGNFVYDTAMSGAESLLAGVTGVGGAALGLNAMNSAVVEAKKKGADDITALRQGVAQGIAEGFFEEVSIGNMKALKEVPISSWKDFFLNIGKSMLTNFSEEAATEIANIASDYLIMGDLSDNADKENFIQAIFNADSLKQIGLAGAGGALMGLGFGAGFGGLNMAQSAVEGARMSDASVQNYINAVNELDAKNAGDVDFLGVEADGRTRQKNIENLKELTGKKVSDMSNFEKGALARNYNYENQLGTLDRYQKATEKLAEAKKENAQKLARAEEALSDENKNNALLNEKADEYQNDDVKTLFLAKYDGKTNLEEYQRSFDQALLDGRAGENEEVFLKEHTGVLDARTASEIYAFGMSQNHIEETQKALDAIAEKHKDSPIVRGLFSEQGINPKRLTNQQKKAYTFAKMLTNFGINVSLYQSTSDSQANGTYVDKTNTIHIDLNAGLTYKTRNTLNQAVMDTVGSTISHELTHWAKGKSATMYNNLQKSVFDALVKAEGKSSAELIQAEMARLEERHGKASEEEAIDEIVARACEDMLKGSKYAKDIIASLTEADRSTLKGTITNVIDEMRSFIDGFLGQYNSQSEEALYLRKMKDELEKVQANWDKLFEEAVKVNSAMQAEGIKEGSLTRLYEENNLKDGVSRDSNTVMGKNSVQFSERSYTTSGRLALIQWLEESSGLDASEQNDIIEKMDAMHKMMQQFHGDEYEAYRAWSETEALKPIMSKDGENLLSVIVNNGDYPLNIDFSTICKKRKTLDKVLNTLVKNGMFNEYIPNGTALVEIIDSIKSHDFEVACALCFVDSKRYRVGQWAKLFTDGGIDTDEEDTGRKYGYNELVESIKRKDGKPVNIDDFNFTNRVIENNPTTNLLSDMDDSELDFSFLDKVMKEEVAKSKKGETPTTANYKIAKAIKENSNMRKHLNPAELISSVGHDAILAKSSTLPLFDLVNVAGGAGKPKLSYSTKAWNSDIIESTKMTPENAYKVGGVRTQSFSDYMANMVFDYIQMVSELQAKQLPSHAYTKEYFFAKIFGMTGMKINMSMISKATDDANAERFRDIFTNHVVEKGTRWDLIRQGKFVGKIDGNSYWFDSKEEYQKASEDYIRLKSHAGMAQGAITDSRLFHKDDNGNTYDYDWMDEDGTKWHYIVDDETFGRAEANKRGVDPRILAYELQNDPRYSKNVGIIWVGVSDAHIRAMLRDANVPMVIPYHKSNINAVVAMLRNIAMYNDYTDYQNTKRISDTFKGERFNYSARLKENNGDIHKTNIEYAHWCVDNEVKTVKLTTKGFDFYQGSPLEKGYAGDGLGYGKGTKYEFKGTGDAKIACDNYIRWCAENGCVPKFVQFADEDNYYKLIEDFRMYDMNGESAMQGVTTLTFDDENLASMIGESLGNFEENESSFDKNQKALFDDINDIIDKHKSEDANIRYADRNLEESVNLLEAISDEDYLREKSENPYVLVMKGTPYGLAKYFDGNTSRDVIMRTDAIYLALRHEGVQEGNYHNLGKETLLNIPKYLADPDVILSSENPKRRMALVSIPTKTKEGVLSVEFDAYIDSPKDKGKFTLVVTFLDLKQRYLRSQFENHGAQIVYQKEDLESVNPQLLEWLGTITSKSSDETKVTSSESDVNNRNSDRITEDEYYDRRIAEIKALDEDLVRLRQLKKSGADINISDFQINAIAEKLMRKYNSDAKEDIIKKAVRTFYDSIYKEDIDTFEMYVLSEDVSDELLTQYKGGDADVDKILYLDAKAAVEMELYNEFWNALSATSSVSKQTLEEERLKHRKETAELRKKYKELLNDYVLAGQMHQGAKDATKIRKLEEANKALRERYESELKEVRTRRDERLKEASERSNQRLANYREDNKRKALINRITAKAKKIAKMYNSNSKDYHINETLKPAVVQIMNALDFSSEQLLNGGEATAKDVSLSKAFDRLYKDIEKVNKIDDNGEIQNYLDLTPDFAEALSELSSQIDELASTVGDNQYVLREMSSEQLEKVNQMLTILNKAIRTANSIMSGNRKQNISDLAHQSIEYLDELGNGATNSTVGNFFAWDNLTPVNAFDKYGEGGKTIFKSFQDGWGKFARLCKEIIDYTNTVYTKKEAREWEKETHSFNLKHRGNDVKVTMSVPQIMSLYCLSRREQALGHLLGNGMTIDEIKADGKKIAVQRANLTESSLNEIINTLTPRQKAVADLLQTYMAERGAELGNETSLARFGIKQFGEKEYFPIESDSSNTGNGEPQEQKKSIVKLLNMSFGNTLVKKANNRVVVRNIFDVFANHMTDMAKYNSLALPVLDAVKWFNYKGATETLNDDGTTSKHVYSLRESLTETYGHASVNYITTFLQDVNGTQMSTKVADKVAKKLMSNYKVAAVAANLRVALLQPTAYVRAGNIVDSKYLAKALTDVAHIKKNINNAKENSGIALWKSMGFFDVNVAQSVQEQIKHDDSILDTIKEKSMVLAELGDSVTWGFLYKACEYQVEDKYKGLSADEKKQKTVDLFEDVVYRTQVVDSTLTRSQIMRDKGAMAQIYTAFMSEPTISYNMLRSAYDNWKADERKYGATKAFKNNGKQIARASFSYVLTAVCASLVGALPDFLRDDDKDEEWYEEYFDNFTGNIIGETFGMIPFLKDITSAFQGFNPSRMDEEFITSWVKAIKKWTKIFKDDASVDYKAIYSVAKAFSQTSGIPISNVMREFKTLWNETLGNIYPSLKIK